MSATVSPPTDLTKLLAPYKGEWVALSHDERKVLGHGKTIEEALAAAKRVSQERPVLLRVPGDVGFALL